MPMPTTIDSYDILGRDVALYLGETENRKTRKRRVEQAINDYIRTGCTRWEAIEKLASSHVYGKDYAQRA